MSIPYHNKPIQRSRLRRALGKEFFILRRRLQWWAGPHRFAKVEKPVQFDHSIVRHRSLLLRPLKNVDMQLQHNKITNLRLAIGRLHQTVVRPGQTFSVWKLVGRPTSGKGYLEGLTLVDGTASKGIGGGLCQLGNLLYWMALHSPLTVKERWRHGYDVFPDLNRTIPFGCGATLAFNYVDLQLQNNTSHSFQINLWLAEGYLHGEITCDADMGLRHEVYETEHCIQHQWWGGYTRHNKIWKKVTDLATGETACELVAQNHAIMMYEPLLEAADG